MLTKHSTAMGRLAIVALVASTALSVSVAWPKPAQSNAAPSQAAPAAKSAAKPTGAATAKNPQAKAKATGPVLTTPKQKASYALGTNIGKQLSDKSLSLETLDTTAFLSGFKDALRGSTPAMSDQEISDALGQLQTLIEETNLSEGQEFLTKNKTKEGVIALPSGLQYKVITMGTGPKPTSGDTVVCDYKGTFIDGKEFDSSYKRGQTASFGVTQVIKGWTEALQLMPVGSKWQLFIPADLAYGPSGRPGIPPNSTLIFDIELHAIKGK